jgi:hypothetical protein
MGCSLRVEKVNPDSIYENHIVTGFGALEMIDSSFMHYKELYKKKTGPFLALPLPIFVRCYLHPIGK